MKFPYGIRDFYALRTEGYLYIDRTDRIAVLEDVGKELTFLRPRRLGKSLLLSMLENYYDVAKANEFERLFGDLAVGRNPTPLHNRYFVMRWDFSRVDPQGETDQIHQAIHDHINGCIEQFQVRYDGWFKHPITLAPHNAMRSFQSLLAALQTTSHKLYLFIDEYDNFANEVMMARGDTNPDRYEALVFGEGILKTVFKNIKGAGSGEGLDRTFITGVSPIVLSDVTSGHNVSESVYWFPEFNDLCGFREDEVAALVTQTIQACRLPAEKAVEAMELMRAFYDGSRFSLAEEAHIYNPTLVFHFLKYFQRRCQYPEKMIDVNLSPDYQKLVYISEHPDGEQLLLQALNQDDPLSVTEVGERFGMREMLAPEKRWDRMASLLCYLGVLTLGGRTPQGKVILTIPNLVSRSLYVERILELALPPHEQKEGAKAAEALYYQGAIQPLCDFLEQHHLTIFDNRDYHGANELTLKTLFLALLYNDNIYIMDSEKALQRTYADLVMIVRPEMHHYAVFDLLLEFKFVRLNKAERDAVDLLHVDQALLLKQEKVQAELKAARKQLQVYHAKLVEKYGERLRLRTYAVIGIGFERIVWEEQVL